MSARHTPTAHCPPCSLRLHRAQTGSPGMITHRVTVTSVQSRLRSLMPQIQDEVLVADGLNAAQRMRDACCDPEGLGVR